MQVVAHGDLGTFTIGAYHLSAAFLSGVLLHRYLYGAEFVGFVQDDAMRAFRASSFRWRKIHAAHGARGSWLIRQPEALIVAAGVFAGAGGGTVPPLRLRAVFDSMVSVGVE